MILHMGFGDIGTILIVVAGIWVAWTFFLSPEAETNRTVGGGLWGIATKDKEQTESSFKKLMPKLIGGLGEISKTCPICKSQTINGKDCQKCLNANKGRIQDKVRNTPLAKN